MLATMFNSSFNSQLKPHAGDIVMLWNTGHYTREEIDNARPVVSTLGNYPFAECLRVRVSDFGNRVITQRGYLES